MGRRRTKIALAIACAACAGVALTPTLVEQHIRTGLVGAGFPDAQLDVASVGLGHMTLRDVHLADGLDLGTIEIDRGVSLLWRDVDAIAIKGANVSTDALARVSTERRGKGGMSSLPFRRADVSDSTLDVRGTQTKLAGTVTSERSTIDVSVSVRDPGRDGWSVEAHGSIVWDTDVTLERGHIDVTMAKSSIGDATIHHGSLAVDVSGKLSGLELNGHGVARSRRVDLGHVDLTAVTVPFTFRHDRLDVGRATATMYGGEVAVDPTSIRDQSLDLVLRARGLKLAELLESTHRVAGTGQLDGFLALRISDGDLTLRRGELRARKPGTLRVVDTALSAKAIPDESPFAVHAAIVNALADFRYDTLVAELAPATGSTELRLSTRGHGRRNRQVLDISVGARGVRALAGRWMGASK